MKRPLLVLDVLMVLGLLLVVAWTPVYLAQDPATRETVGGVSFTVPAVRYGDHITYEVIVHRDNGTPMTSGPVAETKFRAPTATDDAPEGTVLVEERRTFARNITFDGARIVLDERVETRFYDEERKMTLVRKDFHKYTPTEAGADMPVGRPGGAVEWSAEGNAGIHVGAYGLPRDRIDLMYEPRSTWEAIRDHVWTEPGRADDPDTDTDEATPAMAGVRRLSDDELRHVPFAAWHHERVLYARGYTEGMWRWNEVSHVTIDPLDFDIEVRFDPPVRIDAPTETWWWFAEDIPLQAGEHRSWSGKNHSLSVDFVPHSFIRGREPVPLHEETLVQEEGKEPARPPTEAYLFDDESPFVHDVSLHQIREWLKSDDAPITIRAMMDENAVPAGVAWALHDGRLDLLVGVANGRALRVGALHFDSGLQPTHMSDVCGQNVTLAWFPIRIRCDVDAPTPYQLRPDRGLPAPTVAVLPLLRSELDGRIAIQGPELGLWSPPVYREIVPPEGMGQRHATPFKGFPGHHWDVYTGYRSALAARTDGTTFASLAATPTDDHRSFERHTIATDHAGFGAGAPVTLAATSTRPEIIRPLGPEPAYGGLALVALGLLVRFLAALKSGAHLPALAALYAKIPRAKALEHRHREAIHHIVRLDPGVNIDEVRARAELSRTGTFHHLQTLVRTGLLKEVRVGRMRHYFPGDHGSPAERLREAVARHEEWEAVLAAAEAEAGIRQSDLVQRLGRSKSSVSRTGTRLAQLGLVEKRASGREVRLYAATSRARDDPAPSDRATPSTR